MMSQPRSPRQRPPFVVVSVADDLREMEGWRERCRREWRGGGGFVCEMVEVMYEAPFMKWFAFAEKLQYKFC